MTAKRGQMWGFAALGAFLVSWPFVVSGLTGTFTDGTAQILIAAESGLAMVGVLAFWVRQRDHRLAWIMLLLAVLASARGLAASDQPWVFTMGRLLGQLAPPVTAWIVLALPSGRLRSRGERLFLAAAGLASVACWIPTQMFDNSLGADSPVVPCGADCPPTVFFLADRPDLARWAAVPFQVAAALLVLGFAWLLFRRILTSGRSLRRMLLPIVVVILMRIAFSEDLIFNVHDTLATWFLAATYILLVPAILIGVVLGRLSSARALLRMVAELRGGLDVDRIRQAMARALEDPDLVLYSWVPTGRSWLGPDGPVEAASLRVARGRVMRFLDDRGEPLAAVDLDANLLADPDRLGAVLATARIALQQTWAAVRSEVYAAQAEDAELHALHKINRDLHDGAQQRLVALKMKVGLLDSLLDAAPQPIANLTGELSVDVDEILREMRELSHGDGSRALEEGLVVALERTVREAPVKASVTFQGVSRYPAQVEESVYYTVREALQNVAKHVGPAAIASVTLRDWDGELELTVTDNGPGPQYRDGARRDGRGIAHMRERFLSCGGSLHVRYESGSGFAVMGRIPVD